MVHLARTEAMQDMDFAFDRRTSESCDDIAGKTVKLYLVLVM